MALGSIVVRLTMNTADFETDTARAAKIAEKRAAELDATFKKAGIAIGLALSAAVVGVTKAVKDSIDHMDELSKAAQRVGLPTEDFSQLAYAGDLADVSMEDLQGSLGKLVKGMGDAQRSSSAQSRLFKALGIDVLDASGKMRSAKDVLYDFADAFKEQEGSPEIIAAGMNIFGRSFQNIIPLIKDGSAGLREAAAEADRLKITLSTETGIAAEHFNDNITRLQKSLGSLAQNVAADLLPDLVRLTEQFVSLVKEGHGAGTLAHDIADGFRIMGSAAESSITLVSGVATVVGGLTQQLAGFYEMAAALGNFDWERRAKGAAMYQAGGARVGAGADRLINPHGANGLFNAGAVPDTGSYNGPLLAPSKALADAEIAQEAARIKEQRAHAEALRKALGDPEPAANRATAQKALNTEIDKTLSLDEQWSILESEVYDPAYVEQQNKRADAWAAEGEAARQAAAAVAEVLDRIGQERDLLGMTVEQQDTYNKLKWAGVDANSAYGRSIIEANQALHEEAKAMAASIDLQDEWRSGLSDAISDVVTGAKSMKQAFGDFFDDFAARITEAIANRWVEQLFGERGSNGGGSGGDIFGAILGSLFGDGGFGGAGSPLAAGGTAQPWSLHQVNERGFEMASVGGRDYLMAGPNPVQVTPNHKLGGGVTQNVQFLLQGPVTRETQQQASQRLAVAGRRAVTRNG